MMVLGGCSGDHMIKLFIIIIRFPKDFGASGTYRDIS